LKFTHAREHPEGGFTLYRGVPDTKNTYYGVKILKMFNENPLNLEKTVAWIENLQKDRMFGVYGVFYRLNILKLLNGKIIVPDSYIKRIKDRRRFSSIKIAYYNLIISKILGLNNLELIAEWILTKQNQDGGFGENKSDIESTYYALAALKNVDPSLITMKNSIAEFTRNCQVPDGGFAFTPQSYPPYIEPTYAGIGILEIIGKKIKEKDIVQEFVLKLQNNNGGFRRSKYMGISELEYTFKSLYILKKLDYW